MTLLAARLMKLAMVWSKHVSIQVMLLSYINGFINEKLLGNPEFWQTDPHIPFLQLYTQEQCHCGSGRRLSSGVTKSLRPLCCKGSWVWRRDAGGSGAHRALVGCMGSTAGSTPESTHGGKVPKTLRTAQIYRQQRLKYHGQLGIRNNAKSFHDLSFCYLVGYSTIMQKRV